MLMVVAVDFKAEDYELMKMALGIVEAHALAYDALTKNMRSVRGEPIFTEESAHSLQKEIRRNDEQ